MRLPVDRALPLAALILLAGTATARDRAPDSTSPVTGPAADYPLVVGAPFTIGNTVWTPVDQLNYDAVGHASIGSADAAGVTGAHKTLPLPCYVEVTALDTGRTILVRLERRGPMVNDVLVELSPAAATQLGIVPGKQAPIRVRRVNPPEQERAMLRGGGRVPERMDTPEGLLKVLRRKLVEQSPLAAPPSTPPAMPTTALPAAPKGPATPSRPPVAKPAAAKPGTAKATPPPVAATSAPPTADRPASPPPPKPATPGALPQSRPAAAGAATAPGSGGSKVIQVGAFSVEANARKVADKLGGQVSRAGKLWRVRMGPFANSAQAGQALEKARRAGYSDARIQSAD